MIKKYIIQILFGLLIIWNVWLSLRPNQTIIQPNNDHAIFDSLYQRHENRILEMEHEMIGIDSAIVHDSAFVHRADRHTRDSLRAIYNP